MKYIACILLLLSGCVVSSGVSVIGVRRNVVLENPTSQKSKIIKQKGIVARYYEMEIPYEYNFGCDEIFAEIADINPSGGKAFEYDGDIYNYDYRNDDEIRYIGKPYRIWWGYPAQALQVIALPIDVVILPFRLIFDGGNSTRGP